MTDLLQNADKDRILSHFLSVTSADPGLALDLLEGAEWDMAVAVKNYDQVNGGSPSSGFHSSLDGSPNSAVQEASRISASHSSYHNNKCPCSPAPYEYVYRTSGTRQSQPKLARGVSRAYDNQPIITKIRADMEDFTQTFCLPDFSVYSPAFQQFLEADLIDSSTQVALEMSGRLNWWCDITKLARLYPLVTTGDGNCLLHAASLAMWGFHDSLASSEPRSSSASVVDQHYESLEEFHVYVLANVLARPIVIVADVVLRNAMGDPVAPVPFSGIYIPLECESPARCFKRPLILAYDAAHFSALVPMATDHTCDALLVDSSLTLLPIHYDVDPCSESSTMTLHDKLVLLSKYLVLTTRVMNEASSSVDSGRSSVSPVNGACHCLHNNNTNKSVNRETVGVGSSSGQLGRRRSKGYRDKSPGKLKEPSPKVNAAVVNSAATDRAVKRSSGESLPTGLTIAEDNGHSRVPKRQFTAPAQPTDRSHHKGITRRFSERFGSLGKAFRKLGRSSKECVGHCSKPRAVQRDITQGQFLAETELSMETSVLVALLGSDDQPQYQRELIRNYMDQARTRYQDKVESLQYNVRPVAPPSPRCRTLPRQHVSWSRHSVNPKYDGNVKCRRCGMGHGSPDTDYYCKECVFTYGS